MTTEHEVVALRARVAKLEERMVFIYNKLGIEYVEDTNELNPKLVEVLRKGNILEAIKIYREIYSVGLAEAKAAVEDIQAKLV